MPYENSIYTQGEQRKHFAATKHFHYSNLVQRNTLSFKGYCETKNILTAAIQCDQLESRLSIYDTDLSHQILVFWQMLIFHFAQTFWQFYQFVSLVLKGATFSSIFHVHFLRFCKALRWENIHFVFVSFLSFFFLRTLIALHMSKESVKNQLDQKFAAVVIVFGTGLGRRTSDKTNRNTYFIIQTFGNTIKLYFRLNEIWKVINWTCLLIRWIIGISKYWFISYLQKLTVSYKTAEMNFLAEFLASIMVEEAFQIIG